MAVAGPGNPALDPAATEPLVCRVTRLSDMPEPRSGLNSHARCRPGGQNGSDLRNDVTVVRMTSHDLCPNCAHGVPTRGAMVFLYINGIHRRADLYDAPDEFRPERFLGTTPDPYHWLPFGGGINRCLRGHMAMFEARVLLRTVLQEMTFVPERSTDEIQQAQTVLLLPKRRATVTLHRRTDLAAQS